MMVLPACLLHGILLFLLAVSSEGRGETTVSFVTGGATLSSTQSVRPKASSSGSWLDSLHVDGRKTAGRRHPLRLREGQLKYVLRSAEEERLESGRTAAVGASAAALFNLLRPPLPLSHSLKGPWHLLAETATAALFSVVYRYCCAAKIEGADPRQLRAGVVLAFAVVRSIGLGEARLDSASVFEVLPAGVADGIQALSSLVCAAGAIEAVTLLKKTQSEKPDS
uniref:Transmembrane protein n=1 Tax=Chromera velia CCMP2878 TaxID=1169474 RepID=A0A0G4I6A2_9ALVE|mmetsp:Transcript_10575/g.20523  ORF Transcript_10575/g.20523 Transcript_10575/m.20523 type:complete len:224 (+) Transcript_10575:70-741(+)|eukprot:Cvel_11316.t1-p1 / transcript=Cvel_11316.t1 / gene=Cvel_11316 / organism=Chromera_velia_CCMP2878 / gene_product=hypothetical protein / transcript_product=hypothetical protein / location=Cvel_scaffold707:62165-64288(-) / protein_length=223 / sequence_SO=supercontig / SO=protein_coding / is_pseudo=false